MKQETLYIFPDLGDEPRLLITNKHSVRLLAAYQALVDEAMFSSVIVNELPLELAGKLYSNLMKHLNVKSDSQTGGIIITKVTHNKI